MGSAGLAVGFRARRSSSPCPGRNQFADASRSVSSAALQRSSTAVMGAWATRAASVKASLRLARVGAGVSSRSTPDRLGLGNLRAFQSRSRSRYCGQSLILSAAHLLRVLLRFRFAQCQLCSVHLCRFANVPGLSCAGNLLRIPERCRLWCGCWVLTCLLRVCFAGLWGASGLRAGCRHPVRTL
jgi:hypothetical protein